MTPSDKDSETRHLACAWILRRPGQARATAVRPASETRSPRIGYFASRQAALLRDLMAIRKAWAALPVLDPRGPDEIIGYDEHGLPG